MKHLEAWTMTNARELLLSHLFRMTDRKYRAEWQETDTGSWFSELTIAEEE